MVVSISMNISALFLKFMWRAAMSALPATFKTFYHKSWDLEGPCPLGREDNFEIMSFHREKRFISISPRLQTGTCRNMKRKMQFLNGEKKGRRAALHRHTLGSVGKACRDLGPFPHPFCMDHCMPFDMVSREKATSRLNPKLRWHWGTG